MKTNLFLPCLAAATLFGCVPTDKQNLQTLGTNAHNPVSISRDVAGVPHIRAQNILDAFYAQGYVHAQDRLWQMELSRRIGAGRLSEVLGAAALDQDKFLRTWGFYRAAEMGYESLSQDARAMLDAYAAGVNARMQAGGLPLEFTLLGLKPEPWKTTDSLVWAKMFAFDLGSNWDDEIENATWAQKIGVAGVNELKPEPPFGSATIIQAADQPTLLQRAKVSQTKPEATIVAALNRVREIARSLPRMGEGMESGSNNWVVAGGRSQTGKPFLANDPHLSLRAPSVWYFADIAGGNLNVVGATLPGIPGVVIGHNQRIAWGVTNNAPDTQDLFVLDLEGDSYKTPTGLVKLKSRQETIKVKGQADTIITVRDSNYGPVISDVGADTKFINKNQAVSLRWATLEAGDTTLDAFLKLNQAGNWPEFLGAMKDFVTPTQNFVYADVDGNIGYIAPGKIPKRNWDGRFPASATLGQNWQGFRSFEELPKVFNPKEGFIVTANNRVLPHGTPNEMSTYTNHYRAQRIRELILATPKHNAETFAKIQGDTYSIPARQLVPGLLALTAKSDAAKRLQDTVRTWNLRSDLNSVGATAYMFYYRELTRLLEDELGQAYYFDPLPLTTLLRQNSKFCDDTRTPMVEDCAAWQALALERGASALEKKLGSDPSAWQWQKLHQLNINAVLGVAPIIGPLLNRQIATPGGISTVNVARPNLDTFQYSAGPSLRIIQDLSNFDAGRFIYPMGQSGDFTNPHYDDLLLLWRDNKTLQLSQNANDWGASQSIVLRP